MVEKMDLASAAQSDARDAKSSGEGSGLYLDALEKAVARIQWGRTRRMIDKLRRDEACDGTADTAADELERLADAFEFTATPLIETQRELLAAARAACDLLAERTYGHPARSPGHNARLVLEAAIAKALPQQPRDPQIERGESREDHNVG